MKDCIYISEHSDGHFTDEVAERAGTDLKQCYHCRCCASGCPFVEAMDYPPNSIIRLAQFGLREEALKSATIWICVGCHTCSIQCPMAIDIAAVMDAMRQIALEEKIEIAEPDVLAFHREVLHSIERYGRTHKLEIMMRYKVRKHDWFGDLDVGLRMLAKRKLDLMPSKVNDITDIKKLFKKRE